MDDAGFLNISAGFFADTNPPSDNGSHFLSEPNAKSASAAPYEKGVCEAFSKSIVSGFKRFHSAHKAISRRPKKFTAITASPGAAFSVSKRGESSEGRSSKNSTFTFFEIDLAASGQK